MNIALAIKKLREEIVAVLNECKLPASVIEPVFNAIYLQIAQQAQAEVAAAEKAEAEKGVADNG